MSIASEITKLNSNLSDSYTACNTKGATMPSALNFDNLPDCIDSIPTGGGNIYDIPREISASGVYEVPTSDFTFSLPSNVTKIGGNALRYAFYGSPLTSLDLRYITEILDYGLGFACYQSTSLFQTKLTSLDLSNLQTVGVSGLSNAFYNCRGLTTIDLSNLQTVGNNGLYEAFRNCSNLTGMLDLSSLQSVGTSSLYNAFYNTAITSIDLSGFTGATVSREAFSYTFSDCSNITGAVNLSSITAISIGNTVNSSSYSPFHSTFLNCTGITSVDLSGLTTLTGAYIFYNTFSGCTGITSVDLSNLTTIADHSTQVSSNVLDRAFYGCSNLRSVDLSSLTNAKTSSFSSTFYGCTSLASISFSSLTTIEKSNAFLNTFYGCTSLSSVSFPSLTTIGANTSATNLSQLRAAFYNCDNLTSITFPELTAIYCTGSSTSSNGTFYGNNKVEKFYFPKLNIITYGSGASSTNQNACKYIFSNCSALIEIHFGAANQTAIEASRGYSTAWGRGAGNVTIYFDL